MKVVKNLAILLMISFGITTLIENHQSSKLIENVQEDIYSGNYDDSIHFIKID